MTYSTDQRYHFQFQTLDLREKRGIGQGIWIPFARSSQFLIKAFQMMQFKIRIFKENGLRSIKNISILDLVHLLIICVWLQLNVSYRLKCRRASFSYYYWKIVCIIHKHFSPCIEFYCYKQRKNWFISTIK